MSKPDKPEEVPVHPETSETPKTPEVPETQVKQEVKDPPRVETPPSEDDPKEPGGVEVKQNGDINGKQNIAQTIHDHSNTINDYSKINIELGANLSGSSFRFSRKMLIEIEERELLSLAEKEAFLSEASLINEGVDKLKKHGLLILTGEPYASLRDVSVILAGKLKSSLITKSILISDPLSPSVLINFKLDIAQAKKEFNQTTLIFKQPTAHKNPKMMELLRQLSSGNEATQIEAIRECRQNDTYLIITMSHDDLSQVSEYKRLREKGFHLELALPQAIQIQNYLIQELARLLKRIHLPKDKIDAVSQFFDEARIEFIASKLKYIADVDRFVESVEYFVKSDKEGVLNEEVINGLLRILHNVEDWLIDDLGSSLDSWSFVLTLSMLDSRPDLGGFGVSLLEFELFRDQVKEFLIKEVNLSQKNVSWPGVQAESTLYERCRAKKEYNPEDGKTYISFQSEGYSREVWKILFQELSGDLIKFIPFLYHLSKGKEENYKRNAARVLGRLGELDPDIVVNWIHGWAEDDQPSQRVLVGYLFHGIHSSQYQEYQKRCEQAIENCGMSRSYNKTWAAIAAFKQIGLYKLEYAIEQLGRIVEMRLCGPYELMRKLQSERNWAFHKMNHLVGISESQLIEYFTKSAKVELTKEVLQGFSLIFGAITYSLSALCILLEPLSVFKEMEKWVEKEHRAVKILLARMLLFENGILSQLDQRVLYYAPNQDENEDEGYEEWHYMALVISSGEEAKSVLINFLLMVIDIFPEIEAKEARFMEDALAKHVSKWAIDSSDSTVAVEVMADFIAELVAKNKPFSHVFDQYLKKWKRSNEISQQLLSVKISNAIDNHQTKTAEKVPFDPGKISF